MTYKQTPTPHLHPIEKGRPFAPDYGTPLAEFDVTTGEWEHVCCARFGEGRPCSFSRTTKWTGDSYRYDIFRKGDRIALRWWNGAGEGWLTSIDKTSSGESNLLLTIASNPCEEQRWDACHFLWNIAEKSARAAKAAEFTRIATAFTEGRLKKRKVRGRDSYEIKIEPTALTS